MQISFVGDHQIFSLLSSFQQAERQSEEKTLPKRWKGLFFSRSPRFVLVRPHSVHRFSSFLRYTQPLSRSLKLTLLLHSFLRVFPSRFTPTPHRSPFLWSILPTLFRSTSVSASNSNSNSNSFIGMTRESLAWAHSPGLPLHKATRPGPVTSGPAWSTGCVMLRRGSRALCVGSDLWTATLWACQRRVRVRDGSDRVSLFGVTQTTTVLWTQSSSACGCEMYMCQKVHIWNQRLFLCACVCVKCKFKFIYNSINSIHTCARHLERIWVGSVVSVAANTVNGAFTGGTAVDWTLHTGFISLSRLERARCTGWKTEEDTYENSDSKNVHSLTASRPVSQKWLNSYYQL